jgi:hypothetical protein
MLLLQTDRNASRQGGLGHLAAGTVSPRAVDGTMPAPLPSWGMKSCVAKLGTYVGGWRNLVPCSKA